MPVSLVIIDAFSHGPFTGNPAAVCLLESMPTECWMQQVAAEMNLSETAFVVPAGSGQWQLRWFTPTTEVDLCGHATLAAAHALWTDGGCADAEIRFTTRSGILSARRQQGLIELDFPVTVTKALEVELDSRLAERLLRCHDQSLALIAQHQAGSDLLLEVEYWQELELLRQDLALLASLPCRGVIVTAAGGRDDVDFTSRFFAPAVGIAEDPVTGSAHCALADFWGERLRKTQMRAYQASARGGFIEVTRAGLRVHLRGEATTILRGALLVDPD